MGISILGNCSNPYAIENSNPDPKNYLIRRVEKKLMNFSLCTRAIQMLKILYYLFQRKINAI
jgi:hypothetical protein